MWPMAVSGDRRLGSAGTTVVAVSHPAEPMVNLSHVGRKLLRTQPKMTSWPVAPVPVRSRRPTPFGTGRVTHSTRLSTEHRAQQPLDGAGLHATGRGAIGGLG